MEVDANPPDAQIIQLKLAYRVGNRRGVIADGDPYRPSARLVLSADAKPGSTAQSVREKGF